MNPLDPRVTAARPDLAASHLQGRIEAGRFVDGEVHEVIVPQAPVRREPRPDAPLDTEALKGERVTVYESDEEGWAWGQLCDDGYVGWLPADALRRPGPPATHKVSALRTLVFPGPSSKMPPVEALSLGCRLAIRRIEAPFAVTADNGFVPLPHLAALDRVEPDFVTVAERFLGTPYLWGGRTGLGIDCSGLVQVSLAAIGIACLRDADMQEEAIGRPVATASGTGDLQRGDLVFWKGHVAIVRDRGTLLHANAFHMATAVEPVADAIARIRAAGYDVTSVKRLDAAAGTA